MATTLSARLAALRASTVTPFALKALDTLVPGEWEDLTDLEDIVREVTGETDPATVQRIAAQAEALFAEDNEPFADALKVYEAVDTLDRVAAGAVVASKIGERIKMLDFLNRAAPKPDTVQAVDAAVKLAAEVVAFGLLHGLPTASIDGAKALASSLGEYSRAEGMRLAGWIIIDGVIPLGPDFVQVISRKVGEAELQQSAMFKAVRAWLPGDGDDAKRNFVMQAIGSVSGQVNGFVEKHGITAEGAASKFAKYVDVADSSTDLLAAALDTATNYFSHTGTQTVARYAVQAAHEDVVEAMAAEAEVARQQAAAQQAVAEHAAAQRARRDESPADRFQRPPAEVLGREAAPAPPPAPARRPRGPAPRGPGARHAGGMGPNQGWGPPPRRGPPRRRRGIVKPRGPRGGRGRGKGEPNR